MFRTPFASRVRVDSIADAEFVLFSSSYVFAVNDDLIRVVEPATGRVVSARACLPHNRHEVSDSVLGTSHSWGVQVCEVPSLKHMYDIVVSDYSGNFAVSRNGQYVAVLKKPGKIRVHRAATGAVVHAALHDDLDDVECLDFDHETKRLFAISRRGQCVIWDLASGRVLDRLDLRRTFQSYYRPVLIGTQLVFDQPTELIWVDLSQEAAPMVRAPSEFVTGYVMDVDPTGSFLVLWTMSEESLVVDVRTKEVVCRWNGTGGFPDKVHFAASREGMHLWAVSTADHVLYKVEFLHRERMALGALLGGLGL